MRLSNDSAARSRSSKVWVANVGVLAALQGFEFGELCFFLFCHISNGEGIEMTNKVVCVATMSRTYVALVHCKRSFNC
jgi:hypothetical protein